MKMSKKLCSLLLVLCVLCSSVTAFAYQLTKPIGFPAQGITMQEADAFVGSHFIVNIQPGSFLSEFVSKFGPNSLGIRGSFKIAGVSYNLKRLNLMNETTATELKGYQSHFFTAVEGLAASIEAEKDSIPGIEKDENGNALVKNNTVELSRNAKRYFLTKLGVDYSELDNNTLTNKQIDLDEANICIEGGDTIDSGDIPEGSFILTGNESKLRNDVPSTWKTANRTFVANNLGITDDGPWMAFVAPATGTYNVWAFKRDQNDTNNERHLIYDVSGTRLEFKRGNKPDGTPWCTKPTGSIGFYWEPEASGATVTLKMGQKVYIRALAGTGQYAGCYGLAFIPTSAPYVQPTKTLTFEEFIDWSPSLVTPHTGDTLVKTAVTVNGAPVEAVEKTAFTQFPQALQYDEDGNYMDKATVLDALIAGDAADDTYQIAGTTLPRYNVTVNGQKCAKPMQTPVNAGDEIGIVPVDKTNFEPVVLGGKISGNGSLGSSDGLWEAFQNNHGCTMKFVTADNGASNTAWWPVDATANDALADCYINGYIKIKHDLTMENWGTDTTGDDTKMTIFIKDLKIVHSAKKSSGGRLELGVNFQSRYGETIDGLTYHGSYHIENGRIQGYGLNGTTLVSPYDLSNLYITNSTSAAPTQVTVEDKGNGTYAVKTNKSVPANFTIVTKDAEGKVTGVTTEYKILDFTNEKGELVTLTEGQSLYVWEGTALQGGTTMKPLCTPVIR